MDDFAPRGPHGPRKSFIAALQGPSEKRGGVWTPGANRRNGLWRPALAARGRDAADLACAGRGLIESKLSDVRPHRGPATQGALALLSPRRPRPLAQRCERGDSGTSDRYSPPETTFSSHNHFAFSRRLIGPGMDQGDAELGTDQRELLGAVVGAVVHVIPNSG